MHLLRATERRVRGGIATRLPLNLDPLPNQLPVTRQVHTAEEAAGRGVRAMFTKLSDLNKAAIFAVLVLCMSVGAALSIRILGLIGGTAMWTLWLFTPTVAALVMLLVLTRDAYSKEGWKSLGLHRPEASDGILEDIRRRHLRDGHAS